MKPLLVVGDTVLDQDLEGRVERLAADAPVPVVDGVEPHPRPGGAGLAACLAVGPQGSVRLLTALSADAAGAKLRTLLGETGVEVLDLGRPGATPEKLRVRAGGQTMLRLDRGERDGEGAFAPSAALLERIDDCAGVVVSDYGYGVAAEPTVRTALGRLAARVPLVWDPHPRGPAPIAGARLVTPNRREAGVEGADLQQIAARARELQRHWAAEAVAITLGAEGAVLVTGSRTPPLVVPTTLAVRGDPCGAGDSLAVAAGRLLAAGASVEEAVALAVARASEFVSAGGAPSAWRRPLTTSSAPPAAPLDANGELAAALQVAGRVHASGGRLVVTSGCFDLLHAGHVQTLEAARQLGEALVVLLNDDRSVRQLKGPGRPIVAERDRARLLSAMRCVDAVAVFGELTPVSALLRLRPQIFVKGGDYVGRQLPEQAALAAWGGEVVLLPVVDGHSTTHLVKEMAGHAAR